MFGDSVVVEMGVISIDFVIEVGDGGGVFVFGDGVGYDVFVGVLSGMLVFMGMVFLFKFRLW